MIENKQILEEVRAELVRTLQTIDNTLSSPDVNMRCNNHKFAACKRRALDLKKELNKLTQSTAYKWSGYGQL